MTSFEQLGLFYLGKRYDLPTRTSLEDLVLYDSKDLVTHAVCVGMTGSGKTGLGIVMIEEAAIDGIPVLAIDPKGDLANLLLTFPSLAASDFAPWVDPGDAEAQGLTVDAFAAQQADRWQKGLEAWGQDGARIRRLKAAADVAIFTPGSRVGTPLALLDSLGGSVVVGDEDAAARVASTADSLLALAGLGDGDTHSRERTLLASILSKGPSSGRTGLPWLVEQIQRPSFDRVGVLDLETFFPAKDRQQLALRFNSILAAPGFEVWLEGAPLDPGALLYSEQGKPRIAVVSIAHLSDQERMLVVSLLLNAVVDWTRKQRGTSSLRALVYMDEVFGYLPPVANPPSKLPILTLLKQARAHGVGVMLATQNPADLDYKALSNTGTWFLGKLQTERDKARVLDGLEGVAGGLDRATLDATLSALGGRTFLMHNVHEPGPVVFQTRWTLSYLRGPLGRDELRRLRDQTRDSDTRDTAPSNPAPASADSGDNVSVGTSRSKPVVPSGIQEVFAPGSRSQPLAAYLYGSARVRFTDARRGIDVVRDVHVLTPFSAGALPVEWDAAAETEVSPEQLATSPPPDASYEAPPVAAFDPKRYAGWSRDLVDWLLSTTGLTIYAASSLKLTSAAGESERDFRVRAGLAAREARDAQVEKMRARYATRVARATERVRKAEDAAGREQQQVSQQKLQTAVSVGATIFGALLGRKIVSTSTLGRATTAARGVSRSMKETEDLAHAQERVAVAQRELAELQRQVEADVAAIAATTDPVIDVLQIKPKRGNIDVRIVALAWMPRGGSI